MDYRSSLVALVEAYCAGSGRSEARTANLAGSDGKFFARIRDGKTCSVDTLERVTQWFADNWPAETAWPLGVDRPDPTAGARDAERAAPDPQAAA